MLTPPPPDQWDEILYYYGATMVRVIDGDTFEVKFDYGRKLNIEVETLRLHPHNACETKRGSWTRGLSEREIKRQIKLGRAARELARDVLRPGTRVLLRTYRDKDGNFGRLLAAVFWDNGGETSDWGEVIHGLGWTRPPRKRRRR